MSKPTFVIAEAGVNHNGSLDLAIQLVDAAADARADVVKFQTFRATKLVTAAASKAAYQERNTQQAGSQLDMLKQLELSTSDHHLLVQHCRTRDIHFMSTAFDDEALAFLATLGVPALKMPSGDITCGPLLLQAARLRMPLIVSTGMSTLAEIEDALGVIAFGLISTDTPGGRHDFQFAFCSPEGRKALQQYVTLLHCVTQYPAQPQAVNLRAMDTMAAAFGLPVGYSDHTLGVEVSLAAVARGATVIEKHFTLSRQLAGPDHAASLEPQELKQLVSGIRNVEAALGSTIKAPAPEEMPNRPMARRSLVAARPIARGAVIAAGDLDYKRPGTGLSPIAFWDVVGRIAQNDFGTDSPIAI